MGPLKITDQSQIPGNDNHSIQLRRNLVVSVHTLLRRARTDTTVNTRNYPAANEDICRPRKLAVRGSRLDNRDEVLIGCVSGQKFKPTRGWDTDTFCWQHFEGVRIASLARSPSAGILTYWNSDFCIMMQPKREPNLDRLVRTSRSSDGPPRLPFAGSSDGPPRRMPVFAGMTGI